MSTAAELALHLKSFRRWFFGRTRPGAEGSGHIVVALALIGMSGYALLAASVSLRSIPLYPGVEVRCCAAVGWLLWFGSYAWSVVAVLRGYRRQRITQIICVSGLVLSVVLFALLGPPFAAPASLSFSVMLLCLSGRVRGLSTIALLAVYFTLTGIEFKDWSDVFHVVEDFALSSLVFYAIPRLMIFARDLEATRSVVAQLAVAEQRLRWARDLHDTLGHGLSVVVLKLELAERLGAKDLERAGIELADARALLRQSIGDMQTVVAGMRDMSLSGEITNASTILKSAGVVTKTDIAPVILDTQVAETLAWIVREGTTNVLRHSESSTCEIVMRIEQGRAVLSITNDGPAIQVTRAPSGGNGILGMRERLYPLGGRLSARSRKDGGFVLEASVPLPVEPVWTPPAPANVPVEVEL